jgi:hypothetical protein
LMSNGHHDQQQGVPRLRYADHKSSALHEVLSHQSGWAGRGADGAAASGLQAPA